MAIKLHDSLTRETRELRPAHPDGIFRFYNCGPTVYAAAHIGNFRTFVVNDLLRRVLELELNGSYIDTKDKTKTKVWHVRNLTDVDDKTIRRSREEGRPLAEVTKQWTEKFHADCKELNCLPPHEEPRAADPKYMREQVNMIDVLMEKGNAYRTADGSIFFSVSSYKEYGRLSRVRERELKHGASLTGSAFDADEKDDVSDFALWKAWKPEDGENKWEGPRNAAVGRPGWHIECSAMSKAILGPTIDLHTGGVDLLFPHHENEIAQSQCCNGTTFAHHWYHSEHLLVDGKKMSKSLGNLYTLDQLINDEKFSPKIGRQLRLALIQAHPRKQLNFTLDSLRTAVRQLEKISAFHQRLICEAQVGNVVSRNTIPEKLFEPVIDALRDDLNTPLALGELFKAINEIGPLELSREQATTALHSFEKAIFALGLQTDITQKISDSAATTALDAWRIGRNHANYAKLVGPLLVDLGWWIEPINDVGFTLRAREQRDAESPPADIAALAEKRWAAKQAKDFAAADTLRKDLTAAGWTMLDRKDGYSLEPAKK